MDARVQWDPLQWHVSPGMLAKSMVLAIFSDGASGALQLPTAQGTLSGISNLPEERDRIRSLTMLMSVPC